MPSFPELLLAPSFAILAKTQLQSCTEFRAQRSLKRQRKGLVANRKTHALHNRFSSPTNRQRTIQYHKKPTQQNHFCRSHTTARNTGNFQQRSGTSGFWNVSRLTTKSVIISSFFHAVFCVCSVPTLSISSCSASSRRSPHLFFSKIKLFLLLQTQALLYDLLQRNQRHIFPEKIRCS